MKCTRLREKNIIDSKQKSKRQQDRKCRSFKPQVEEYYTTLPQRILPQAKDYYNEPCRIVRILSCKNVIIELPNGEQVFKHIDKPEPAPLRSEGEKY